jgi:hypothetical protein
MVAALRRFRFLRFPVLEPKGRVTSLYRFRKSRLTAIGDGDWLQVKGFSRNRITVAPARWIGWLPNHWCPE